MRTTLGLVALVAMLGTGYAMTVEAQPQRDATAVDVRNDRDDGFNMGWLGLIGLAGLLGMKRAEARDRNVTRADAGISSTTR